MSVQLLSKLRPASSLVLPLVVRLRSLSVSFAGFGTRYGESPTLSAIIMVKFCFPQSSCSARCGQDTKGGVDGGSDVLNFRAELKLLVLNRKMSTDRSSADPLRLRVSRNTWLHTPLRAQPSLREQSQSC